MVKRYGAWDIAPLTKMPMPQKGFFVRFTIPVVAAPKFLGRLLLKAFPEAKQKAYKSHTVNVKQVHLNRWEKAKEFSC